ncbi:uncharacterized protein CTRU02_208594 [Colletotrichum truncatum]|uniref:Uncharacterized protein n=1 Tax=Colletotrichum truncatum TaxID=5467 RepID=A0ACC3YWT0_COLTU|nr:uncharacterized protein CTRU02_10349 [Colletotrichum truncatum]KAF6787553.1 hypothetical protein CTRU02_10349 [Colletotrichum truncatum]
MDPLSIIASVAGISQAGALLSKSIYDLISATRGAPKEITDIARGISELSVILSELRRVLRDGKSLFRRRLLRNIRSTIKRIGKIHHAVGKLIDVGNGAGRLKWAFRRSTTTQLLYQIEAHKSGINMVLHTMVLAIQIRMISSYSEGDNTGVPRAELKLERDLSRRQTENQVESSFHALRQLTASSSPSPEDADIEDQEPTPDEIKDAKQNQLVLWDGGPDDTAAWLYRTVFSSFTESLEADNELDSESLGESKGEETGSPPSVVSRQLIGIGTAFKNSNGSKHVVNELLAEWTVLTNEEIDGIEPDSKPQKAEVLANKGSANMEELIHLNDAVGRKFILPFQKAKTWEGLTSYLNEAFKHVDIVGPHVMEGHFDIVSKDLGDVILLPSIWGDLVKPGYVVDMRVWPIEKPRQIPVAHRRPFPPPGMPAGALPKSPAPEPPSPAKSPEPQPETAKTRNKKKPIGKDG